MWECRNCQQEIADKYKHCWNCGNPKTEAPQESSAVKIRKPNEPPPAEELKSENKLPPEQETPPGKETPPPAEFPLHEKLPPRETVLFEDTFPFEEKSPSKIGSIVPLLLWLAAVAAVSYFAYYSYQKTTAFENRIAEEARNLSAQTNGFVFAKDAPRERNGKVKAKVLPLSAQTKQIDGLYNYLPDDLRPATLEEVRTLLWLDCTAKEVWRYDDGTPGFRESCNAYLVDRDTSRIIQVEDFAGEMPPMKKNAGNQSAAPGKVLPQAYISFIKANQTETERTPLRLASDSPEHHFWFKSELLYALILLGLLAAAAVGWIVFKIKSAFLKLK